MPLAPDPPLEVVPLRYIFPQTDRRDQNVSPAAGAIWGTANDAVFVPFEIDQEVTVIQIHIMVTTTGGNVDVGLYDEFGVRLVSNGAVATAAAGIQTFNITDITLGPGRYFFGISCSLTTPAFLECTPLLGASANGATIVGAKRMATAHPLPATATYAVMTRTTLPMFVLECS